MTERQQEYIKILAAEIENENVRVVYSPFKMGGFDAVRVTVTKNGSDRKAVVNGIVPTDGANWDIAIKNLRRKINHSYGESIV